VDRTLVGKWCYRFGMEWDVLSGCATVHQEDLDAWKGAPVAALETHPVFMTMPVV
jgi:hypothetical protein